MTLNSYFTLNSGFRT